MTGIDGGMGRVGQMPAVLGFLGSKSALYKMEDALGVSLLSVTHTLKFRTITRGQGQHAG